MHRYRKTFPVVAILVSILACQTSPEPQASTAVPTNAAGATTAPTQPAEPEATSASLETRVVPTEAPDPGEWSWIFDIPAEPVNVDMVLETDNTVEALIPLDGGTLSATGADGTVYTLEIPANALFQETMIGLTPASSVAGLPFGGEQTYSVQFSPEGLFFYTAASLTIIPAEAIPLDQQLIFGYQAEGDDVILAAPVAASGEIKILVNHFSGNGVTRGLLADLEPARERVGGSAERRLENVVNEELIRRRQQALQGNVEGDTFAFLEEALNQYEAQVVEPRVDAAGDSCAAGQVAVQSVYRLARMRALLGLDGGDGGDPLARYPGLMEKAAQVCVVEEFELCVEEHVIHRMVPVWLGFERQFALLGIGDAAVLREARELTVACLTFTLNFESTGTLDAGGGGYESRVTSEITLHFNPDDFTISGEAPLVNEEFEYFLADCDVNSVPGDGAFEALKLIILDEPDDQYGHVRDFIFTYMPGNSSESFSYVCDFPGGGHTEQPLVPFPAWTNAFLATHIDEMDTGSPDGGGFVSADWEIFGDEYFAKKEWFKESGEIVEVGTFKLYHHPGQ